MSEPTTDNAGSSLPLSPTDPASPGPRRDSVGPFGALFESFERIRAVDPGETPLPAGFDPRWRD